jgi:hypothetical protein
MSLETIDVVLPPSTEPTFDTPAKALVFGEAITRKRVSNEVSSCYGAVIRSVAWNDTAIQLRLDNDRTLTFRRVQNDVEISLDDTLADMPPALSEKVRLRLAGQTWTWERNGLITAMVGRTFRLVQATQSTFFLYVSGLDILWIHVLIDGRTGHPFLCWSPTD